MACDPQKPMNFQIFTYAGRRQPRSKEDNRGPIIAQKKDSKYVKKNDKQKLIFKISAGTSQKSPKMTSWSLPEPLPGGVKDPKSTQKPPRAPQDGPKSPPYNFQTPLFRPERSSEADSAPKTPQEDSRGPPGGRNLTCGAPFGTHGRRFS